MKQAQQLEREMRAAAEAAAIAAAEEQARIEAEERARKDADLAAEKREEDLRKQEGSIGKMLQKSIDLPMAKHERSGSGAISQKKQRMTLR